MLSLARRLVKKAALRSVHRRNEAWQVANNRGTHLPPALWGLTVNGAGHLCADGCDFRELARTYGTPLHVVNTDDLRANYDTFLGAFRREYPQVEIGYSYKTNPVPGVLQTLHGFGACAEVISHYELWLALQLGVAPEMVIFNGPAKTDAAVELAVSRGIRIINVDGLPEIDRIAAVAARYGRRQGVGVRVTTSVGWSSQFGVPISDGTALAAFERLAQIEQLNPQGIHIHIGTGIRNVAVYEQAISEVLAFAETLRQRLNIDLRYLDFGGGFGVPTVQNYSEWDNRLKANGYPARAIDTGACPPIERYAAMLGQQMRGYIGRNPGTNPSVVLEPGRAITSRAQYLLLEVLNLKPGKQGMQYAIMNGGKNLAMPLGYEQHELFPADRMHDPLASGRYDIAGPLCYPEDILFKARKLPELRPGDLLAIMDAGAYFISNQQNFSNPRPAVVRIDGGTPRLIREREQFEDMVRLDQPS
jgi:diaminopimelate decarboxylase